MIVHLPIATSLLAKVFASLPDIVHWLPVGAALLLGLLLGGVFWRQREGGDKGGGGKLGREGAGSATAAEGEGALTSISAIAAYQAEAAERIAETTAPRPIGRQAAMDRRRLVSELAQASASAERHRAESEATRARAATLAAHLDEQSLRVGALTGAVERSLGGDLSPRGSAVAAARASLIQVAESVRGGRQWLGAAGSQLDSLQRRIEAAEQRLWATAEETAGFRQHLDGISKGSTSAKGGRGRRPSDAQQRLHHRVVEVDEQMRVYHQHLAGCLTSVDQTRATLEPNREPLRLATAALTAAEQRLVELGELADQEIGDDADQPTDSRIDQRFEDTLGETEDRLAAARSSLGELDDRAIEHAGEVLERCHWVATEAPQGLRDAVRRFGESDSIDDISMAMMLSRSWRKISEVGVRLDTLSAVAEGGSVGDYPDQAVPAALSQQLARATAAIAAIHEADFPAELPVQQTALLARPAAKSEPVPVPSPMAADHEPTVDTADDIARELEDAQSKIEVRDRQLRELRQRCEALKAERDLAQRRAAAKSMPLVPAPKPATTPQRVPSPAPSPAPGSKASPAPAGVIRALRPGDFARHLVGLTAYQADDPERLGDLGSAAGSFAEAQAVIAGLKGRAAAGGDAIRLRPGRLENGNGHSSGGIGVGGDERSRVRRGERVADLQAAFEKTLVRSDLGGRSSGVGNGPGQRRDLKRLEAASEDLLSAVAEKKKKKPFVAVPESAPELKSEVEAMPEPGPVELNGITPGATVAAGAGETVVFRGDDPRGWGSRDLSHLVADDTAYLRLRRLDTGESVVAPIGKSELISGAASFSGGGGWSGAGEPFFGGVHLGLFDASLPREVETGFGVGGWGFGHSKATGSGQAFGWAGQAIEATAFEISVGIQAVAALPGSDDDGGVALESPAEAETDAAAVTDDRESALIFCGNDPSLWNRTLYQGTRCRALALDELPAEVSFLRLRRLDSGESVLLATSRNELLGGGGEPKGFGFNAGGESFYGARHFGVYDECAATDVETRFTYGGWGFGHGNSIASAGKQCAGWAGQEIAADTVFEITVFRDRPEALVGEVFLGAEIGQ